jgi:hypothetical protein
MEFGSSHGLMSYQHEFRQAGIVFTSTAVQAHISAYRLHHFRSGCQIESWAPILPCEFKMVDHDLQVQIMWKAGWRFVQVLA